MDPDNTRKGSTLEQRRSKMEEIDAVSRQIQLQEAESRQTKTQRLRALRLKQAGPEAD